MTLKQFLIPSKQRMNNRDRNLRYDSRDNEGDGVTKDAHLKRIFEINNTINELTNNKLLLR